MAGTVSGASDACGMGMWDEDEQEWIGTLCDAPDPAYEVLLTRCAEAVPCCAICALGVRRTSDGRAAQLRTRRSDRRRDSTHDYVWSSLDGAP